MRAAEPVLVLIRCGVGIWVKVDRGLGVSAHCCESDPLAPRPRGSAQLYSIIFERTEVGVPVHESPEPFE